MLTEFQKAFDITLTGLTNTYGLDNLLIVSYGTLEEHILSQICLKKLDAKV